jgi:glutaredoxin
MDKEIVMYSRSFGCPYVRTAKRVLEQHHLSWREIHINKLPEAKKRVVAWTGYESVPTLVIARVGEDLPYEEPSPLKRGKSPRGINRGSMITEPSTEQLSGWLRQHGFII